MFNRIRNNSNKRTTAVDTAADRRSPNVGSTMVDEVLTWTTMRPVLDSRNSSEPRCVFSSATSSRPCLLHFVYPFAIIFHCDGTAFKRKAQNIYLIIS